MTLPDTQYFTGKPCKHGHVAPRWKTNRVCVECSRGPMGKSASAKWRKTNPERAKEVKRLSNVKNAARNLAYSRAYEAANREQRIAARRIQKKDPALRRLNEARRRARKVGAGGQHTAADVEQLLISQRWRCVYCRADLRQVKREVDHIVALAAGGSDEKTNLQILCKPCNASKKARDPIEFAQTRGMLL
jgi:5-methylcytosine-specific restriction endonuclease McrA